VAGDLLAILDQLGVAQAAFVGQSMGGSIVQELVFVAPQRVVAFFDKFPPLTNQGQARYAEALNAMGRRAEAVAAARKAWTSGSLSPADEGVLLSRFAGSFTTADQDERMDRLLWAGKTTAALRQLPLTSMARRNLYDARLALRSDAPDAGLKADAIAGQGMQDAGFIADKARWMTANGNVLGARALLAQPRRLTARPVEAEKWLELLLATARASQADGQFAQAYAQKPEPEGRALVIELDEMWHYLKKSPRNSGSGRLGIVLRAARLTGSAAVAIEPRASGC